MIPHWKKLAKIILNGPLLWNTIIPDHTATGRRPLVIHINNICLPKSVLDIILPCFYSVENLTFGQAELGNEGFLRLSTFLEENTTLKSLCIAVDKLDDVSVATSFSDAIRGHPTLSTIMLSNCGLNGQPIVLRKIFEGCVETEIQSLLLSGDDMSDDVRSDTRLVGDDIIVLADFIQSNPLTKTLFFRHNDISNNDTVLLASALKKNTNLINLDLEDANITEAGEKTLLNALFDPTSMDSIVASNHSCRVYTYDIKSTTVIAQRPPLEQEVLNINEGKYTIGQKIRKKVVLALCGVEGELFDLSHFNDLPLQLMPRVLELIQEHSQTRTEFRDMPVQFLLDMIEESPPNEARFHRKQLGKDALSRLFHTLRGWELPLLFENLNTPSDNRGAGKRKRRKTRR